MGLRMTDGTARKNFPIEDVPSTASFTELAGGTLRYKKATLSVGEGVAVGDVDLDLTLPAGSVVLHSIVNVKTTFTSASTDTGTIAVTLATAGDICAAAAISAEGDVWDAAIKNGIPVLGTPASAIVLSAEKTAKVTVGVAALTAGEMDIYLFYV